MATNVEFDHMSTTSCSSVTLNSAHSSVSDISSVSFSCPSGGSFNGAGYCSARSSISCDINSISDYGSINKPHKANNAAWEAIRSLRSKDGSIGINHFKLLARLGSGDIGNVYLCQLRSDGTDSSPSCGGGLYAMKVVDKAALAYRDKLQRAEMEKQILSMLDHPFLPTLYAHFDASHYSCLVMEFCPGGDLHSLRQRQHLRRFSLKAARFYTAEVVVALEYLHMMGVIYRDLKPENILVREDGHIMLSDFDLSLKCDAFLSLQNTCHSTYPTSFPSTPSTCSSIEPVISCFYQSTALQKSKSKRKSQEQNQVELVAEPNEARSKSFVGTHEYLAPEIISGQGHGSAVDWYTLGIFIYELIYGTTPFKGANNEMTLVNILSQPLRFPHLKAQSDIDSWYMATDIIKKLLVRDPRYRLGSSRGAADIKRHPFFKGINWALIRSMPPPEVPALHVRSLLLAKKNPHTYQQQQLPSHFDYF